eukprot:Skav215022  [mRNA]  locus=scaffold966:408347:415539:- [translate_table: standard]
MRLVPAVLVLATMAAGQLSEPNITVAPSHQSAGVEDTAFRGSLLKRPADDLANETAKEDGDMLNDTLWDDDEDEEEDGDMLNDTLWDDDEDEGENGVKTLKTPLVGLPAMGMAQKLRGTWGCCSTFKGEFGPTTAKAAYRSCISLTYNGRLICRGSMVPSNVGSLGTGSALTYVVGCRPENSNVPCGGRSPSPAAPRRRSSSPRRRRSDGRRRSRRRRRRRGGRRRGTLGGLLR